MELVLEGKKAFAYTAAHDLVPRQRALVFIHGAGLEHSMFGLQSRYFGYHGWNVLAVDLPGHGRSAGPPLPTIEAMAEWIFLLLQKTDTEKAGLVGHSMGSLVALECAARRPQTVERIALIGVADPMKVSDAFLDAARRDHTDAFDMDTIWGHAPRASLGGNPNPGMWMYGDTLARLRRLAPGVLYSGLKACNDYALKGEVKCPALLILGQRDLMTPPKAAAGLQKKLANARSVVIDSGHTMMAEAPDATLDALIGFLR